MRSQAYASTDPGCVREINEDAFLVDHGLGLYIVCDGLGGHAAGDVASHMACRSIQRLIKQNEDILTAARAGRDRNLAQNAATKLVAAAVQQANADIYEQGKRESGHGGMGCTLVLLLILGEFALIAHAGDSRAYLLRDDTLFQLTEDHAWLDEQLKRGIITPEQARSGRHQSVVTRAIGTRSRIEPDVLFLDLLSDDRFLLCSDGLTRYLDSDELQTVLIHSEHRDQDAKLPDRLVRLAKEEGGHDNITALTLTLTGGDAARDLQVLCELEVIAGIPLFTGFKYIELLKLMSIARVLGYAPGERVIREGHADRSLMICIEGAVEVRKSGQVISRLGKRDFFGELSLIDKLPRSADVVAVEPSRMIEIERLGFLQLIDREPHLGVKVLWEMCRAQSKRLRRTSDDLIWSRLPPTASPDDG